jgi:hypothetical protein
MMGMMILAREIMYFCGDTDSWDQRSLMIGMGRMGMGGMGGMGMGGMGGMMGGGMRSVPPTGPPFADLKPRQTRHLPTRLVSLSPPDSAQGLKLPEQGESLEIGDIGVISKNPQVQKALKRLAADKVSSPIAQLVMWHLSAGLDWDTIADLSREWSNRYELTLARDFVDHIDRLPAGEAGRVQFQVIGGTPADESIAAELVYTMRGKIVLGLRAERGIPLRPEAASIACRIRLNGAQAAVQVQSTDAEARTWISCGKFTAPARLQDGKPSAALLADAIAEGLLNRLVRVQLIKGPRDKDKPTYRLRIDNASPLVLNGLAALGTGSPKDEVARVLSGISIPPHRSMSVPASEEVVKALQLKHGVRVVAIDLSAL